MRGRFCSSRIFSFAFVFAAAGFCYALSVDSRGVTPGADDRSVGTGIPLRFTNPHVFIGGVDTGEFDLGDVCGSSLITRYVTAEGGLRPYRITSQGSMSLQTAVGGTGSTLILGLSGIISGQMAGSVPVPSAMVTAFSPYVTIKGTPGFRFQVSLQDAKGTSGDVITGFFNLFFVNCKNIFRFAMSALPDGRLATDYMTSVDTVGGTGPVTFSVVSVSGAASSQETLGLFVASDGTVFGKPLVVGTVTITIHAVDSKGVIAQNRAGTGIDQAFTFNILDNPTTTSDMATLSCSVRGDSSKAGRDRLSYSGIINVLGQDNFALTNSFVSFHLGGISISGKLDKRSQFTATLADKSKVRVRVSPNSGIMTASISNGNFTKALTPSLFKDGVNTRKALGLVVGDAVAATEVLDFATKINGSQYTLTYALGRKGANAGGGFQMIRVRGKDLTAQNGVQADSWNISFLAMPRLGVAAPAGQTQGVDNVSSATVRIGTRFIQKLPAGGNNNSGFAFRGDRASLVRSLRVDSKRFKGQLTTAAISPTQTGIGVANQAPRFGNIFLPLGLDLTRTGVPFSGEHARRIFGLKNIYKDIPPK